MVFNLYTHERVDKLTNQFDNVKILKQDTQMFEKIVVQFFRDERAKSTKMVTKGEKDFGEFVIHEKWKSRSSKHDENIQIFFCYSHITEGTNVIMFKFNNIEDKGSFISMFYEAASYDDNIPEEILEEMLSAKGDKDEQIQEEEEESNEAENIGSVERQVPKFCTFCVPNSTGIGSFLFNVNCGTHEDVFVTHFTNHANDSTKPHWRNVEGITKMPAIGFEGDSVVTGHKDVVLPNEIRKRRAFSRGNKNSSSTAPLEQTEGHRNPLAEM